MDEAMLGYPHHKWLAVGHLAEAESELVNKFPELANIIRAERLNYMSNNDYAIDISSLIMLLSAVAGEAETDTIEKINIQSLTKEQTEELISQLKKRM